MITKHKQAISAVSTKIIDLTATVDNEVVRTETGPMVWGTVEITYAWGGLEPRVTLRVPVPAFETQSDEQRRAEAVRRARKLIDHACVAMESTTNLSIGEMLEGISEELGILSPTTEPRPRRQT